MYTFECSNAKEISAKIVFFAQNLSNEVRNWIQNVEIVIVPVFLHRTYSFFGSWYLTIYLHWRYVGVLFILWYFPTGETNFKCTFQGCTAAFINASVLNRHVKSHSNEKTLTCPICDKSFYRSDHLKNHQRSHSIERPFPCSEPGMMCTII